MGTSSPASSAMPKNITLAAAACTHWHGPVLRPGGARRNCHYLFKKHAGSKGMPRTSSAREVLSSTPSSSTMNSMSAASGMPGVCGHPGRPGGLAHHGLPR